MRQPKDDDKPGRSAAHVRDQFLHRLQTKFSKAQPYFVKVKVNKTFEELQAGHAREYLSQSAGTNGVERKAEYVRKYSKLFDEHFKGVLPNPFSTRYVSKDGVTLLAVYAGQHPDRQKKWTSMKKQPTINDPAFARVEYQNGLGVCLFLLHLTVSNTLNRSTSLKYTILP